MSADIASPTDRFFNVVVNIKATDAERMPTLRKPLSSPEASSTMNPAVHPNLLERKSFRPNRDTFGHLLVEQRLGLL